MEYIVGTMHGQGFARMFRTERFAPSAADHPAVKAQGREIAENGFALIDKALAGKDYLAGAFSIADAALFFVEFWAARRLGMTLPVNCAAHFERMLARPAVRRAMQQEGLA
jgi:glutathione S-transferase